MSVPEPFRDDLATDVKQTNPQKQRGFHSSGMPGPETQGRQGLGPGRVHPVQSNKQQAGSPHSLLSVASALCDFGQVLSLPWASVSSSAK